MIEFVNYDYQCPWIDYARENAKSAALKLCCQYTESKLEEYYGKHVLACPFNTIINDSIVCPSPLSVDQAIDLHEGKIILFNSEQQVSILLPAQIDEIRELDTSTAMDNLKVCGKEHCRKTEWLSKNDVLGWVGYCDEKPVCIIELIPSTHSPYRLPANCKDTYFINCFYSNDEQFDYRESLLTKIIPELKSNGIKTLFILSGENHHYPNGTVEFLERIGFIKQSNFTSIFLYGKGIDNIFLMEYGI